MTKPLSNDIRERLVSAVDASSARPRPGRKHAFQRSADKKTPPRGHGGPCRKELPALHDFNRKRVPSRAVSALPPD